MKIGISYYHGINNNLEKRAILIKDAGISTIMTSDDKRFRSQNGSLRKQVRLLKKYQLELSSLHMRYNSKELPDFWKDTKLGYKLFKNLKKDIKFASKYGFTCVVVHVEGEYSNIGEKRIKKLLDLCEKLKVYLAIENTNNLPLFEKIFTNIEHDYLKFCYDSGHNNVYNKEYDYFDKYGDKLVALHLHSNDGSSDQHTLNEYGNVDWDKIAKGLAKCTNDISLDYEVLFADKKALDKYSEEEILKIVKQQGDDLSQLIDKYKK